jgi:hypothetical protein
MQVILGQLDYRILQRDNHSTRTSKSGSELAFKPQGLWSSRLIRSDVCRSSSQLRLYIREAARHHAAELEVAPHSLLYIS